MTNPNAIQDAQIAQCEAAMREANQKRLRVKLTYIVGGMLIGAAAAMLRKPKTPMKSVVIGAIAGEYVGWLLHGLKYNRWFL